MQITLAKAKKLVKAGSHILITREQMKTAVMMEPLRSGRWVHFDGYGDQDCSVCAVGAALRTAGVHLQDIRTAVFPAMAAVPRKLKFSTESSEHDIQELLKLGHYLMALSARFESWSGEESVDATPELRCKLVDWIDANMPEMLLIRRA